MTESAQWGRFSEHFIFVSCVRQNGKGQLMQHSNISSKKDLIVNCQFLFMPCLRDPPCIWNMWDMDAFEYVQISLNVKKYETFFIAIIILNLLLS